MGKTKIAWTQKVWNPLRGCTKVSPGCEHCYAETMAGRFPWGRKVTSNGRWNGNVELLPERLGDPSKWRKPSMVFVSRNCHGEMLGHLEEVDFSGELHIRAPEGQSSSIEFARGDTGIRVDGLRYSIYSRRTRSGNIFWDNVSMSTTTALRLAKELLFSGWEVDEQTVLGPFANISKEVRR